jgi:hypothetical protein
MGHSAHDPATKGRPAWNAGRKLGAKRALKPQQVWAIRFWLDDEMEARFRAGGADGFNIMPATLPGGLDDFIELVLPELRRRGLFRQDYEGRTLRGHLGSRPPPGFAPGTPTGGLHR